MIEIVKEGRPLNEINCGKCECVFHFDEKDVLYYPNPWWFCICLTKVDYFYVNCPKCGNEHRHVVSVIDRAQYERLCKKFDKSS
jgi:hypothetical protein